MYLWWCQVCMRARVCRWFAGSTADWLDHVDGHLRAYGAQGYNVCVCGRSLELCQGGDSLQRCSSCGGVRRVA